MPPEMTIVSALLRPEKVKFKTAEFTWAGRVFGQNTTLLVRRDSGIKTFEDLMSKQVIAIALVQSGYDRQKGIENVRRIADLLTNDADKAGARTPAFFLSRTCNASYNGLSSRISKCPAKAGVTGRAS